MESINRFLLSLIFLLITWEIIGRSGFVSISLFPPPSFVAIALAEMLESGDLIRDILISLKRALAGLFLGGMVGACIGMLTGRVEWINGYLSPVIQLLRPLPPVALIPFFLIWFGIGESSKILSISFAVFFPVWINSHHGAYEIPKTFLWSAKTLHLSAVKTFWKVIFPCSVPFIITGFRTGIAMAFIMVFVAELAGASSGVGYQINISYLAYRMDRMMAALVVLAIIGALTDYFLTRFILLVFPWLRYSTLK